MAADAARQAAKEDYGNLQGDHIRQRTTVFVAIGLPAIAYFAIDALRLGEYLRLTFLVITATLIGIAVWFQRRDKGSVATARPAVLSFAALCLYLIAFSGPEHARALWFMALPLVAILLLPPVEGGAWSVAALAGAVVLMTLSGKWDGSPAYSFDYASRFIITATLITGAVLWSEILLRRYQRQVAEQNRKLASERDLLEKEIARRSALEEELRRLASTDTLTGLLNRRAFEAAFAIELARCQRNERPFSALALDIDHFKKINDRYGHPAGDAVLVHFARTLQAQLRPTDTLARVGGEEFVVLFSEAADGQAEMASRRLLQAIRATPAELPDGTRLSYTASGGGTDVLPSDCIESAMNRADKALYSAKESGRDRLCWR